MSLVFAGARRAGYTPVSATLTRPTVCAGCTQSWLRFSSLRSTAGGSLSSSSTDVESCLSECRANSACVFVDHAASVDPQQCYIHTNAADLNQVVTDAGYNQFVLVRRCAAADCTYRARQLYKNISMLFLFPVKDGKPSTGVIAIFNASCYG